MKPQTKKILAGALIVGVGATWVPQILSAGQKGPAPRVPDDSAEMSASASSAETPAGETAEKAARAPANSKDAASAATPASSERSLEKSIALAKSLLPEKTGLDLDKLAQAWSLEQGEIENSRPAPASKVEPEGKGAAPAPAHPAASPEPPIDPVTAFLAAHPLQGTLISETKKLASLGSVVVYEGDDLGNGLVVVEIGERYVIVSAAGTRMRLDIAPFQARPKSATTGEPAAKPPPGAPQPKSAVDGALEGALSDALNAASGASAGTKPIQMGAQASTATKSPATPPGAGAKEPHQP